MTRDDIIRMAQDSGLTYAPQAGWVVGSLQRLERFALLVAEHEREKVAKWMLSNGYATGHGDTIEDLLRHLVWEEREACAIAAWSTGMDLHMKQFDSREVGSACARAIRARGQK